MDWVIGLSSRQRFFGSFASSVHMRGCVYMSMFDVQKSGGGESSRVLCEVRRFGVFRVYWPNYRGSEVSDYRGTFIE